MDIRSTPVAVAVSGGADSLYSLVSLREQGLPVFALHGIFLKAEYEREALPARAMRARLADFCAGFGVPFHSVDLADAFERLVIRPFVADYASALTPNPCAACNARIKFGLLREAALSLGASRLATGHYVRLEPDAADPALPALFQGRDLSRDQSYFLALTPADALKDCLFPLSETTKAEVCRRLAGRHIAVPQPGESREVCFVPGDDYRAVLPEMADRLGPALPGPGPMLLPDGTRVGRHEGLWRHTEGQRRGLGIGWKEPLYVLGKDLEANVLRVGPRSAMGSVGCVCGSVNLFLPVTAWPDTVLVKTRYRETPREARAAFTPSAGGEGPKLHIRFVRRGAALAPGQVAAVYVPQSGSPLLRLAGGGVIEGVA